MPTLKTLLSNHEAKSTLGFALLISALFLIAIVLLFENSISSVAEKQTYQVLEESVVNAEQTAKSQVREYMSDLKFLHATPPIQGIVRARENNGVDPVDTTTSIQWKRRLETIFVGFIENNEEIDQLRIIEASGEGMEYIRVVRDGGSIHVASEHELQAKGERGYFTESLKSNSGEFYISDINLNREYGALQYPYKSVIRISLPIFGEAGVRFGFIIMNINASHLVSQIESTLNAQQQLYITDSLGYFVTHPQSEKSFSKDLNPNVNWKSEFNVELQTGTALLENQMQSENMPYSTTKLYSATRALSIAANQQRAPFFIHVMLPENVVQSVINEKRITVYSVIVVVTLIFCVVLSFVHRSNRKNIELAKVRGESVAIIASSKDAIFSIDSKGIVKTWNMSAESLFDLPSQLVINHPISAFEQFAQLDIDKLLTQTGKQNTYSTSFSDDQGNERKLLVTASTVWTEQSHISGVAVVIRDITDEQQAKDAIERVNAKLEEKVASRTKELMEATEEAKKASEIKSSFISNISHEMRTPLNGVVGSLSLLKRQPLNEKAEQLVSMMEISCNNLNVLINDVLDLSKIEAGKLDINHQQFSPLELVESIARGFAVKAASKGLELIVDTTGVLPAELISDPHRINQIISNLLNNAIKFTHTGHIQLKVDMCEVNEDEYEFHVVVSDTGVGIAKENQPKLFTAFTQADAAVATQYGGTGLGLSICKQLSKLLGGDIEFHSTHGTGSTFSFYIRANVASNIYEREDISSSIFNGLRIGISANYAPLQENLCSLVMHFGAKCSVLSTQDDEIDWTAFTVVIVDETSALLSTIDETWEALLETHDSADLPLICVLQKIEAVPIMFKHLAPVHLSKPLLSASFDNIVQRLEAKLSGFDYTTALLDKNERGQEFEAKANKDDNNDLALSIDNTNLLVVDDNLINREIAKGVLEDLPCKLFTCCDGEEVVAFLLKCEKKQKHIHCILMDCQMPKMNGYEATRAIRNGLAGASHQGVPIIAMTANAMLGEKEKCLEAGMDDFTTKPVMADVLIPKVKQWLLHRLAVMTPKNTTSLVDSIVRNASLLERIEENKPTPDNLVNRSDEATKQATDEETCRWEKESALARIMGDKAKFARVCESYAKSAPEKLKVISHAIEKQDSQEIQVVSLKLKVMSADIGAVQLKRDFEKLWELSKVEDWTAAEQLMLTINDDLNTFIELLEVA